MHDPALGAGERVVEAVLGHLDQPEVEGQPSLCSEIPADPDRLSTARSSAAGHIVTA
ncbi:hypothetical protein [Rhizorhabdus argentea]|uniref:hypothetical protein n=1 Tax=Rhizorhabdus argentea TaxID=1387174 RepID=UPI0030ED1DAF